MRDIPIHSVIYGMALWGIVSVVAVGAWATARNMIERNR